LLLRQDAERDFIMGQEIEALGIKTNHMEYVLELDVEVELPNGNKVKPCLLQYDVECPYRVCDAAFMMQEQIQTEVMKWEQYNERGYKKKHMIAANVLIRNLLILHDHNILHNAISEQNYTWALELLDFELACSSAHPYTKEDDMRHVKDLFPREIIQTYVVINYIAGVLREEIDYAEVDALFAEYGFDLRDSCIWWPISPICLMPSVSATRSTSRANCLFRCLTCCTRSVLAAISIVTMSRDGSAKSCTISAYQ